MSSSATPGDDPDPRSVDPANTMQPLPGEAGVPFVQQRRRLSLSRKGLLAVGLLACMTTGVAGYSIVRYGSSHKKSEDPGSKLASNRPAAASVEPRLLDLSMPEPSRLAASAPTATRVPALVPTADELADPIAVRRTGEARSSAPKERPEDAPIMIVTSKPAGRAGTGGSPSTTATSTASEDASAGPASSDPLEATRQNLDVYQRQLRGLLDNLTRTTTAALAPAAPTLGAAPPAAATPTPAAAAPPSALVGAALPRSATPRVAATMLGNRSLILSKGTAFTCALTTKVVSAISGLVGCLVQRNVYSDDGRVLLVERGSHLDGEYRIASVRPGTVRIPVVWTRVRTPLGVTVDIDSPAVGQLGESGIDGYVDNRWGERLGAAMLLSLIDDSVKLVIQGQASEGNADTIVLPSTTSNTSKLAEKVLDSTINIPPLVYRNQGGIVGIYVARDVDFSSVYELHPTPLDGSKP